MPDRKEMRKQVAEKRLLLDVIQNHKNRIAFLRKQNRANLKKIEHSKKRIKLLSQNLKK